MHQLSLTHLHTYIRIAEKHLTMIMHNNDKMIHVVT